MIVWAAGLPGVGKTTFLSRALSDRGRLLYMDELRHTVLQRNRAFRSSLSQWFPGYMGEWPLAATSFAVVHSSPERYLRFQRTIALQVAQELAPRLQALVEGADLVVIELSAFWMQPFGLTSRNSVQVHTSLAHHVRHLQARGWSSGPARNLANFYRSIRDEPAAPCTSIAMHRSGAADALRERIMALSGEAARRCAS